MTIHISAKKEDVSNIVIMPGDPLRAKLIAEKYLDLSRIYFTAVGRVKTEQDYKKIRRIKGPPQQIPLLKIY